MIKKSIVLQGILLTSLLLVGCGNEKKRISFFYYSSNDSFIVDLAKNLENRFSSDYETVNYYAENSQSIQNNQLTSEIDHGAKLLVVNICDRFSASTFIEKAKTKDIPIIFVNREPLKEDVLKENDIYYVGTDPVYEGKEQANIADIYLSGYKNFAGSQFDKNGDGIVQTFMIKGEQGHQDSELRTKHSIERLKALGYNVQIVQTKTCDWDAEKAKAEFSKSYGNLLNPDGSSKIELMLSNNDDMAFGVVDYLKSLDNYDPELSITEQFFPIIGVNGNEAGIKAIEAGDLYGTVKNDFEVQADAIYKLATRIIDQKPLDDFEYEFTDERFIHIEGTAIISK